MTFSSYRKETKAIFTSLKIMNMYELIALFMYFHMVFCPHTSMNIFQKMKTYKITTHDQLQRYILIIKELIMGNSL